MSKIRSDLPLLDARIRLDSLPSAGRHLDVSASDEQRDMLAERLGILSVEKLGASLRARTIKGGIEVSGTLVADVTQACVVTFEPVPEHIEENLFRLFLNGPSDDPKPVAGAEIYVDLDGEDLPDHFEGPEVDLTEWLVETLSLALEPYPRKDGAEIDAAYRDDEDDGDSPFDALKALKTTKE